MICMMRMNCSSIDYCCCKISMVHEYLITLKQLIKFVFFSSSSSFRNICDVTLNSNYFTSQDKQHH